MKATFALSAIAALVAKVSADCFSTRLGYPCCQNTRDVAYSDGDGDWGVENGNWCGIQKGGSSGGSSGSCWSESQGYPCCKNTKKVEYTDASGSWGVENGDWCGIPKGGSSGGGSSQSCWSESQGYPCCKNTKRVEYTDGSGSWGIENGDWCGIPKGGSSGGSSGGYSGGGSQYTISGNPFEGVEFYINPYYVEEVEGAIAQMSDSSLISKAEKMKNYSNAIWLDTINNMQNWLESNLQGAAAQHESTGNDILTVFIVYDLPGRDCHALASNGELLANDSDWERYQHDYIDVIEGHLKNYVSQPVALVVEPDSLANMVTNLETTPACRDSEKYYKNGHAYLLKKLGVFPHVAIYLDIGHAWWLGWDDNREKAGKVYKQIIQSGSPGKVRGFADNVSNYTPWEDPTLSRGPETEWNPCPDEKRYLQAMYKDFTAAGIQSVHFISDSSRNGKKTERTDNGEWCNVKGCGIGARPKANPISGMPYLDAFYWVKPVGESDGTSDRNAERFDGYCGHESAMQNAPEAGKWFQEFFEEAIRNANPPL